ncbi:MAG: hypothetical protein ACJ8DC_04460 [Gemmatimonadales bacterium]
MRSPNRFLALMILAVALGCGQDAQSPTVPESGSPLAATAAAALSFRQVSAGEHHTCGVTTGDRA